MWRIAPISKLDGVAPLIPYPPPANFNTVHIRLVHQDKINGQKRTKRTETNRDGQKQTELDREGNRMRPSKKLHAMA